MVRVAFILGGLRTAFFISKIYYTVTDVARVDCLQTGSPQSS